MIDIYRHRFCVTQNSQKFGKHERSPLVECLENRFPVCLRKRRQSVGDRLIFSHGHFICLSPDGVTNDSTKSPAATQGETTIDIAGLLANLALANGGLFTWRFLFGELKKALSRQHTVAGWPRNAAGFYQLRAAFSIAVSQVIEQSLLQSLIDKTLIGDKIDLFPERTLFAAVGGFFAFGIGDASQTYVAESVDGWSTAAFESLTARTDADFDEDITQIPNIMQTENSYPFNRTSLIKKQRVDHGYMSAWTPVYHITEREGWSVIMQARSLFQDSVRNNMHDWLSGLMQQ
ncbi:hypothetical protein BDP27DRAFT_1315181 [Rhodocollybia butyracea]|uniref:Uncharacterized protein n=1 Tax=Rhodocollybia butyracea TaxID=206335 RepID=A0A9P5PZU8_9AGAR|nr:hypothetical protein BDP27DRAFT_1315181 [Rhodocollybia butyracea]